MKFFWKCIFLIIFCTKIYADDNLIFPPEINPFVYIYDEDKDTSGSMNYELIYFFPRIRIWGWSEYDNKVAYSIQERDSWSNETDFVNWYIFDFVGDKVIWHESTAHKRLNDDFLFKDIPIPTHEELFEYSYNLHKDKINEMFKKHDIVNISVPYKPLPIIFNNKTYTCNVSKFDEDKYIGINEYTVTVEVDGKKKIIKHKKFNGYEMIDDVYLCGYFISPFEERAIIVIAERDFTVEEYELRYYFIGCHLEKGFNTMVNKNSKILNIMKNIIILIIFLLFSQIVFSHKNCKKK